MKIRFALRSPPGEKEGGGAKDPVEYVYIQNDTEVGVGRPVNEVARPATDDDKNRWSAEYEQFKKDLDEGKVSAETTDESTLIPTPPSPVTVQLHLTKEQLDQAQKASQQNVTADARSQSADTTTQQGDTDLSSMNADDAVQRVYSTMDRDTLTRMRRAETHGKNRVTVLTAIDEQRENLKRQG